MSTATAAKVAPASSKSQAQKEAEEYLSRIKLKEIFQVREAFIVSSSVCDKCVHDGVGL